MLWLIVVLAVVVALAVYVVYAYNSLVRVRNEAETGWANIDVQLRRRADLIPNLVEAVKGYAAHERGVFDEVTKARARRHAGVGPSRGSTGERGARHRTRQAVRRRRGLPGASRIARTSSRSRTS